MRIGAPDPASLMAGVPESVPVIESKFAQPGLFWIVNDSGSPSGSLKAGLNRYAVPAGTDVCGEPEIEGAPLAVMLVGDAVDAEATLGSPAISEVAGPLQAASDNAVNSRTTESPVFRWRTPSASDGS